MSQKMTNDGNFFAAARWKIDSNYDRVAEYYRWFPCCGTLHLEVIQNASHLKPFISFISSKRMSPKVGEIKKQGQIRHIYNDPCNFFQKSKCF